jgi:hypothetical protein
VRSPIEREYDLKPKWWAILLGMCHFALGVVVSFAMAARDGSDIVRAAYWVVGGLCIGLMGLLGVRGAQWQFLRRRVALTSARILLPKSLWTSQQAPIDYGAITGLFVSSGGYAPWACRVAIDYRAASGFPTGKVKRARFLYVTHPRGTQRMAAAEFPSRASFEEFCELLASRVRASQPAGHSGA